LRPTRSIAHAQELIESELEALAAAEVGEEEFARVQNLRTASFFFGMEQMGGFGGIADRLNAYNVFRGDPGLITADVQRFRTATRGQLREVAVRYLAGTPRVTLSVLGRKSTRRGAVLDRRVAPSRGEAAGFRAPVPHILTLRCGLPLWVFPRGELPTVAGSIVITGGASTQPLSRPGLAPLTADMLDEGTASRSAAEIAMVIEAMGASLSASCGWDGTYVGFRCLKPDLAATLDLAADITRNPTFPATEWRRVHGQTLAALQTERDSAEARAYRALLAALYDPQHPYRFPLAGTEENVRATTTDDLKAYHARWLVPGLSAVVVAGDVAPEPLAEELDRRLAAWHGPALDLPPIAEVPLATRPRLLVLDRPGAPQAVVRAGHRGIARLDPAYEPILLFNQVFGGQFTSRLNEKLREQRGFTYGVRSQFECRRGAGPFSIGTSVQSDRLAEALDDIRLELEAIVTSRPPTQEELDDARRALIEGQPRHFETPSALVNRYASLLVHGLPADHEAGFTERLHRIERDALIDAARAHIHPGAMVFVVVADAAQVVESLKRLGWADLELIED
jgi:zinc protease